MEDITKSYKKQNCGINEINASAPSFDVHYYADNKNNLDSAISNGADPKISRLLRIEIHKPIYNLSTNQNIELEGFPLSGRVILGIVSGDPY